MTTPSTIDRSACAATFHGTAWAYYRYRCCCADAHLAIRSIQVRGTGIQGHGPRGKAGADPENIATALHRARRGDPPPLINVPERRAVIATLTAEGWSAGRIAVALGLAQRNVVRHRTALRKQAA